MLNVHTSQNYVSIERLVSWPTNDISFTSALLKWGILWCLLYTLCFTTRYWTPTLCNCTTMLVYVNTVNWYDYWCWTIHVFAWMICMSCKSFRKRNYLLSSEILLSRTGFCYYLSIAVPRYSHRAVRGGVELVYVEASDSRYPAQHKYSVASVHISSNS